MPRMEDYATPAWPLRMSALNSLVQCPGMAIIESEEVRESPDYGSVAAANGTAVGRAIELYHLGAPVREAIERIRLESEAGVDRGPGRPRGHTFRGFETVTVEYWLTRYAEDPRNAPLDVCVPSMFEAELRLELPCAPEDLTGKPVVLVGHCDQVRRDKKTGRCSMWDVKSGKGGGVALLYNHAWQIAAYTLAAEIALGEPVDVGGVIRVRGYDKANTAAGAADVFFMAPYTRDQCLGLLEVAVQHVAWIRMGIIHTHPGEHCQWCSGDGPQNCGAAFGRLMERGKLA